MSGRRLVIDARAHAVRRQVGAIAWLLYEELALASESEGGKRKVATAVRRLAADVGVSHNTVARGLRRLRDAGVVDVVQSRDASGVFTCGAYVLHLPDGVSVLDPAQPSTVAGERGQLSFELDS